MGRKALSVTVTTVILALAILILSSASAYLVASIFEIQSQQTEFNQAKEVAVYLAQAIEDVAFRRGTSAYVRFNMRSTRPSFVSNWGSITVTISDPSQSWTPIQDVELDTVMVRGGSYASTSSIEPLRGFNQSRLVNSWREESLIICESTPPLVWVYSEQSDGAKIWIDPARIRVTYLGVLNYSWGMSGGQPQFQLANVVEVEFITLSYGGATSGTTLNLKVVCSNVTIEQLNFNSGVLSVTVDLTIGSSSYTHTILVSDYYPDINPTLPTIVDVIVSRVEVHMLGM